jgi:hypothetical protein
VQNANAKITIAFIDPDLDAEERNDEVQKLLRQMRDLDGVEEVERVLDPSPPAGNKSLGGFLVGLLMAEVSPTNCKKVLVFLGNRLSGKQIELTVKAPDGRELSIKANSQAEFEFARMEAQRFLQETST